MATFFGEVLPVVSRAIDEDEFEETASKIYWKKTSDLEQNGSKSNVEVFVKCSKMAKTSDFKEFGEICQKYLSDDMDEKCIGKVYMKTFASVNNFVVIVNDYISLNNAWDVSKIIVEKCKIVKASEISVFEAVPKSEYKPNYDEEVLTPLLKVIASSSRNMKLDNDTFLQQPNMIKGLSSALFIHSQLNSISCVVYLSFNNAQDVFDVDKLSKLVTNADVLSILNLDSNLLAISSAQHSIYM